MSLFLINHNNKLYCFFKMCAKNTTQLCKSEIFTCRRILFTMVTTCFIMNSVLKTIFNITIVGMVKEKNHPENTDLFEWDVSQRQNVLGIFFWGFALTKIPSGRLAEIFGSRTVTGYSMAFAAILTILTPTIARFNYYALLTSRVLMGFLVGATWPAIMPLTSNWIPPTEQSVFLSSIASSAIGQGLSSILGGLLTSAYGWSMVFYVCGGITFLWSMIWFYLIYDSPEQHPRISDEEREEMHKQIETSKTTKKKIKFNEVPWKSILTCGPVWGIALAQTSSFFGIMTIATELPSYLDQVLHYNIKQNGLLSGLPNWGVYLAALFYGYLADRLIKSKKLSTTTTRKIFGSGALLLPSIFMITLGLWGDNAAVALIAFSLGYFFNAAVTAGHCPNILDISPNFAGTICGLVNMLSSFTVYFSTKLVAILLRNGHSFQDWRPLFWILSASYGFGGLGYFYLCSAELQNWDSKNRRDEKDSSVEMTSVIEVAK